jgi:hypothetical protein
MSLLGTRRYSRRVTQRTTIAALAAVVIVAAGCGGGGDKHSPHHDFVVRADRACVQAGFRPVAPPKSLDQAARQADAEARRRRALQAELTRIAAPADLKSDYADFVRKSGAIVAALDKMRALARAGRQAGYALAAEALNTIAAERKDVADRIGFKRCGQPITSEERKALEP